LTKFVHLHTLVSHYSNERCWKVSLAGLSGGAAAAYMNLTA